ncbi:hypothetical protein IG631_04621 [Alternaria alternata]|nr:hypothetical protein IG631_04621 [Alternaria alternata]
MRCVVRGFAQGIPVDADLLKAKYTVEVFQMVGVLDIVSKRRFLSCRFAGRDELEEASMVGYGCATQGDVRATEGETVQFGRLKKIA